MTNYLCRFPDGTAGLGLLVLRTCYAPAAFGIAAVLPPQPVGATMLRVAAGVIALLLLAGHVGGCAAIALLGPGAYSADARRHGHRVIHLRTRTPDRGGED